MKNTGTISLLFILLLSAAACYRPHHIDLPNESPKFNFYFDATLKDSIYTINLTKKYPTMFYMRIHLISGNPVNYPISVSFSGVPAGINNFQDFTSQLNIDWFYNIKDSLPTGIYPFDINVRSIDTTMTFHAQIIAE